MSKVQDLSLLLLAANDSFSLHGHRWLLRVLTWLTRSPLHVEHISVLQLGVIHQVARKVEDLVVVVHHNVWRAHCGHDLGAVR